MRHVTRIAALLLSTALVWHLMPLNSALAQATGHNQELPSASLPKDSLDHVSTQAKAFISGNTAQTLPGPLSPELAATMRTKQFAAEKAILEGLQASLKPTIRERTVAGVPVVVIAPRSAAPENGERIALYIHGGGYALKSALDVTALLMAEQLGLAVYSVDYRLAPEHPFPQGLDDCLAVYGALLQQFSSDNMVVFGGSAGGGLALAMLLKAKQQGLPLPRALGLFSPWTDLSRTGDSYYANEGRDPVLSWEDNLEHFAAAYAGGLDRTDPLLSPVQGEYAGFPPTLVITGTRDLFLSNSVRLARKMLQAGVDAELRVWEEMFHGFDLMPELPEGEQARREMAGFLRHKLGQ